MDDSGKVTVCFILGYFTLMATCLFAGWADSVGVTYFDVCGIYSMILIGAGIYHYIDWLRSRDFDPPLSLDL